jgi:hypothetical protein
MWRLLFKHHHCRGWGALTTFTVRQERTGRWRGPAAAFRAWRSRRTERRQDDIHFASASTSSSGPGPVRRQRSVPWAVPFFMKGLQRSLPGRGCRSRAAVCTCPETHGEPADASEQVDGVQRARHRAYVYLAVRKWARTIWAWQDSGALAGTRPH